MTSASSGIHARTSYDGLYRFRDGAEPFDQPAHSLTGGDGRICGDACSSTYEDQGHDGLHDRQLSGDRSPRWVLDAMECKSEGEVDLDYCTDR